MTGKTEMKSINLKEVTDFFADGDWIESKDQSDTGFRLVQTGNVGIGRYLAHPDRARYISVETFDRLNCTKLNAGDILISRLPDPVGRACLFPGGFDAITAVDCTIIRVKKDLVLPEWVHFITQTQGYQKQVDAMLGGSTRLRITRKELGAIKIPLPPLAEQRRIAAILRTWDEAIETAGDELSRLKEQLVSLIAKLTLRQCVGKPEQGWHDVKIGDLLEEVDRDVEWDDGKTFSLISCGRRASGIFLREKKAGSDIDVKKMYEVQAGDFIVSQKQSAHAGWGMVTEEFHGHHVSPMYTIYGLKGKGLHMPFFNWLCKMPWMRHQAYLSSYGVHIEKMSFVSRLFLKTKVRIPTLLADQEKACAVLESAESEIKAATLKLEKLNDQKRGLMQKLLTGEVRVAA